MSPITHLLTGWLLANSAGLDRRERTIVTVGAVIPDIDGLGIVAEVLTRKTEHPLLWFSEYHHVLHNIGFAAVYSALVIALARRRARTALLACAAFHLHLFCDLVGARGPDGDQWPIPYLLPFSNACQLAWDGQWALNSWPNFLVTGAALVLTFYLAWVRGYSPIEMVSPKADSAFVRAIRNRFSAEANQ